MILKQHMNELTEALRSRWPTIWLDAVLHRAPTDRVIIDSLRFREDLALVRSRQDYIVLALTAPSAVRYARLSARGQLFDAADERWPSEFELNESDADVVINNSTDSHDCLLEQVKSLLIRKVW